MKGVARSAIPLRSSGQGPRISLAHSAIPLALLLIIPLLLMGDSAGAETLSHGRFKRVEIYLPRGQVKHFAFLLSGDGGWGSGLASIARRLAREGTLVAGIDTPQLYTNLEEDTGQCVFPDGDLENLSRYIQAYYKLPTYFTPILIGHSAGASMAYAMLAQAPQGTFAGAVSLSFCVDLDLGKPLCRAGNLRYTPRPHGEGSTLLPASRLSAPWIALHGEEDGECSLSQAKAFVAKVQGARFVALPGVGHNYRDPRDWLPQFNRAYASIAASAAAENLPVPPALLAGLPIVEVPASGSGGSDTFAVLFSGDGGWAGIDKEVAARLAASGIPVAGVDSLRYFWSPRSPAGMAKDLDRILRYYSSAWHRKHALVIGYSQGADVLPFAVNRLPAATRPLVKLVAMIGISNTASFEFHVTNWLGGGDNGLPTAPEIRKLSAVDALCVYGDDDSDSICPKVNAANARVVELSGGHHFGGDYDKLARLIVDSAR